MPGIRNGKTGFVAGAAVCLLIAGCLFLAGCAGGGGTGGRSSSVKGVATRPVRDEEAARKAYELVNEERRKRGMAPLGRRTDLDAVAYAHARDLLRMNRLSHVSSDGRLLENRLDRQSWIWAGENLARNKGFTSPPAEAVRGWIASPKHNENMFRPDFRQTGMAAIQDPGSGFVYFVQVFIVPA